MEYRVLGPLTVLVDGAPIEIKSPRQRVVLAVLLLDANRVVTLERLVDALWDDEPPATAKNQVHICVFELRRKLAVGSADVILTRSAGYLLQAGGNDLDMRQFENLVAAGHAAQAQGRPQDAARGLREAVGLWEGPAFADVKSNLVQAAAVRLNEDRLAVLQQCIDLELELGQHHDIISELGELVARHPLREGLRTQLMLALYRDGRQADALEVFRTGRETLVDELGLDPGQELRDMERAILEHHPAIRFGAGEARQVRSPLGGAMIPRQLPAAVSDFVAREDVLGPMRSLLLPSASSAEAARKPRHLEVVVLSGRSGVGKTALALFAAQEMCDHYADGQLYAELETRGAEPTDSAQLLAGFLEALGVPLSVRQDSVAALAQTYRSRLAGRRVLVVLDGVTSASQVLPLLPGTPSCAVIITSRNRLPELPGARHFEVGEFDEATGVEMIARVIGDGRVRREREAASALVRLCGGLPVALRIAAAKLSGRPHWAIRRMVDRLTDELRRLDELALDEFARPDTGIRASISLSYESLSPDARRLLRRLAVLGATDFAYWVGAPLVDLDMTAVTDLMEQLVEARLVDAKTLEDGSVRMHLHELIRVYALERLIAEEPAAERSAALRRVLGCWLYLAGEAHRRIYGGDYTILHGKAERHPLPTEAVDALLGDPLGWFRSERTALIFAIGKAAQAGHDELCWDMAMASSTHFEAGSYLSDWRQACDVALDAVRRAGNRRGEGAVLCSLAGLALNEDRLDDATRCLDPALRLFDDVGDQHGWALVARGRAYVYRQQGRYADALPLYHQALSLLRSVGDRAAEAHVLSNLAQVHIDQQRYDQAQDLLVSALAICREVGVERITAQVQHRLGDLHLRNGELTAAQAAFESVLRTVQDGNDVVGQAYAWYGLGMVRVRLQQPLEAEAALSLALEMVADADNFLIRGRTLLALAELSREAGRMPEAAERLTGALTSFRALGSAVWQARVLTASGHLQEAGGDPAAAVRTWRGALVLLGSADPELRVALAGGIARLHGAGWLGKADGAGRAGGVDVPSAGATPS